MLAPLPISDQFVGAGLAPPAFAFRRALPAFASRRAALLCRAVASARPPLFVIPNEVRDSAPSRVFNAVNPLFLQRVARPTHQSRELPRRHESSSIFQFPFSIFHFLFHKHCNIRPAQDRPNNEHDHRNRGQIQQPIPNAGIEQRRRIVRIRLIAMEKMSMEKPVGNMRHSHDNLLAQAACAAQSSDQGNLAANVLAPRPNVQTLLRPPAPRLPIRSFSIFHFRFSNFDLQAIAPWNSLRP
jgi:hypothetical protein